MATTRKAEDPLRSQASQLADTVATTATQAKESVRGTLREQADARLDGLADHVDTVGEVLHETAQSLSEKQRAVLASQTHQLATQAQAISRHLRESSAETLLREAEEYTRSQPALVLGAAALVGFATARLLKAGGSRRMASEWRTTDGAQPMVGTPSGSESPQMAPTPAAPRTSPPDSVRRAS